MTKAHGLNRCQACKGKEIDYRIHSDLGVEQEVGLRRRDCLAGGIEVRRQSNHAFDMTGDLPADGIVWHRRGLEASHDAVLVST